jgi:hypothetical protein
MLRGDDSAITDADDVVQVVVAKHLAAQAKHQNVCLAD